MMNTETIDIAKLINDIISFLRTWYLDNLVAYEDIYHNVFFTTLKEQWTVLLLILGAYTLVCALVAYPILDWKDMDTYMEIRISKFKKALKGFVKYGIISLCMGCIFIPMTQPRITRAYDTAVEQLKEMEDQTLSYINLETINENDLANIKEALIKQVETIDCYTYYLQDVTMLSLVLYAIVLLFGLASMFSLILAVEIYIFTYTNKKYKKFKQVL